MHSSSCNGGSTCAKSNRASRRAIRGIEFMGDREVGPLRNGCSSMTVQAGVRSLTGDCTLRGVAESTTRYLRVRETRTDAMMPTKSPLKPPNRYRLMACVVFSMMVRTIKSKRGFIGFPRDLANRNRFAAPIAKTRPGCRGDYHQGGIRDSGRGVESPRWTVRFGEPAMPARCSLSPVDAVERRKTGVPSRAARL
jgi:hypothetical protein